MLHVLGNACRDIAFRVEILPRQGETLNARITYGGLGGKGLNQAIAAARAEMDVRLIAAVGKDSAASLIATRCGLSGLPLRDVDRRVSISSGDALLLQGNLLPDPTLHAAKRAKQAGAKVIFNAAPYRDWCKTMSHDVDVSDRSHENAALLKLFLIAPPPEKARDLFHSRERGLRAD
jgi:sugar/nucleoside kinase (ribokinase family)